MIVIDPTAHQNALLHELKHLRQANKQLQQRNQDLEIALSTISEHGDLIEAQLYQMNLQLKAEVRERVKAQTALQCLLEIITRQKSDLEIIVQTIMEHGDTLDTQWQQKFGELMLQADLDSLTQIANRRRFDEYFEQQWKQMARSHFPLSVILCDIDYFKLYNDTYGHLEGDTCLRKVAASLQQSVKRPSDLVARYGGEEFVALLPDTTLEGAVVVAQRMQSAIAQQLIPHERSLVHPYITVSVGIASSVPTLTISKKQLLTVADQYLYLAKQRGRNTIVTTSEVQQNVLL
jgi:diguanylate cyclase (GGDEF)-like protein